MRYRANLASKHEEAVAICELIQSAIMLARVSESLAGLLPDDLGDSLRTESQAVRIAWAKYYEAYDARIRGPLHKAG